MFLIVCMNEALALAKMINLCHLQVLKRIPVFIAGSSNDEAFESGQTFGQTATCVGNISNSAEKENVGVPSSRHSYT